MATTSNAPHDSGSANGKEVTMNKSGKEDAMALNSEIQCANTEAESRVESMWEQMNKGIPKNALRQFSSSNTSATPTHKVSQKPSNNWMNYLQMKPASPAGYQERKTEAKASSETKENVAENKDKALKETTVVQNNISEEAKKIAAASLSAVKDAAAAAAAASNRGKIEITEVRDFAGQDIEIKKRIHADSKEAAEKAKTTRSAVDAILEQIKKKQKLSVLDNTKKDWGEFKEENQGMEEELDAYKKSSNQYLDKVSFLQRTDYREFERERDARLALQARRRPEMREDP
ncbi:Craniofacial development protein 1 isoform 2 [Hibiscus syriacus]|uniref:Craniofacial development protein 1 isoform 2 n=1 Tax=Hibiscus syriacus TaxID=106335 RepID=A0A6A3CY07_HIBSY|nr:craniofacial development protein 1-like [Hibiscus syriacus]KAE8734200.1 Craniofacial development protein 1 isoform 2 [Hibiscus syriacus]